MPSLPGPLKSNSPLPSVPPADDGEAQMVCELANWIVYGFFRCHLCPVKQTYYYVRGTIGRSGDFNRQVCRGRDDNKKEWKNRGEVKKKAEYSKNDLVNRDPFFMA